MPSRLQTREGRRAVCEIFTRARLAQSFRKRRTKNKVPVRIGAAQGELLLLPSHVSTNQAQGLSHTPQNTHTNARPFVPPRFPYTALAA